MTNVENKNEKKPKVKKQRSYKSLMKSILKSKYTDSEIIKNQKKKLNESLIVVKASKVDKI